MKIKVMGSEAEIEQLTRILRASSKVKQNKSGKLLKTHGHTKVWGSHQKSTEWQMVEHTKVSHG